MSLADFDTSLKIRFTEVGERTLLLEVQIADNPPLSISSFAIQNFSVHFIKFSNDNVSFKKRC